MQNRIHPKEIADDQSRPMGFFFLVVLLACLVTFLGFQFGGVKGAVVGFLLTCVVNYYALQIKLD